MAVVHASSGKAMELTLSWCRKEWFNCANSTKRLIDSVVSASFSLYVENKCAACVGRALCNSEWCPGYFLCDRISIRSPLFVTSLDHCAVCSDFELLTETKLECFSGYPFAWQPWQGCRQVPDGALISGSRQGLPVYIAKTKVDASTEVVGGFVPSLQMASFNHQMKLVQRNRDFDLLVIGHRGSC